MSQPIPPNRLPLTTLIQHLVYESHSGLTNLVQSLHTMTANERKQRIFDYIHQTHERFIRLLVLIRWVKNNKKNFDQFDQYIQYFIGSTSSLQFAANSLYNVDLAIKGIREPVYDLPTAIDVLTTGTYERLPFALQEIESHTFSLEQNAEKNQEKSLRRLNDMIRMKLLQSTLPERLVVKEIDQGQVVLFTPNEFVLILTLKYDDKYYQQLGNQSEEALQIEKEKKNAYIWRILHLQFLVNEAGVTVSPVGYDLIFQLKQTLQARLDYRLSENALDDLYNRLHAVSIRLVADILSKQSQQLQLYKWKTCSIYCDPIHDLSIEEVAFAVRYWKGAPNMKSLFRKLEANGDRDALTYDQRDEYAGTVRCEVSKDRELIVQQQYTATASDATASYKVNFSQLDLSQLLSTAIRKHIHHLLSSIADYIQKDSTSFLDIVLETKQETDCYLKIHMFERYNLYTSIDWRTGKFMLSLKKDSCVSSFDIQPLQDQINQHDELKTKQPFVKMLIQAFEKARRNVIIFAYTSAAKLLGLDTFQFLSGLDREREQKSDMLFIRFPNYSDVFISVKANATSNKQNKAVSIRIVFQVIPKLVERKISDDLFPEEGRGNLSAIKESKIGIENGHGPTQVPNGHVEEEPVKKKLKPLAAHQANLVAFKHLKKIIENNRSLVGKHLIIGQLEAKDGLINFQTI